MTIRIILLIVSLVVIGCSGTQHPMNTEQAEMLSPDYHVITGRYRMDYNWSITLPDRFNKRNEKDCLVIWRPGFSVRINFRDNDRAEAKEKRLNQIKAKVPSEAFDIQSGLENEIVRFEYRIAEKKSNSGLHEFHGFVIGDISHVEMVFSFERESDLELAREIFLSVKEI